MTPLMHRRSFITLLGGAALAWPLSARAQQASMPIIGFLAAAENPAYTAFRQALGQAGYVGGKNVAIDLRSAEGQYERLQALAADLAQRQVAVIATNSPVAALAAKAATTTIPIVFSLGTDPVRDGLVASLNRPGGNITGVTFFANQLFAKRLALLHELLPQATLIAVLLNPNNSSAEADLNETQVAAQTLGLQLLVLRASTVHEIDAAFANLVQQRAAALFVSADVYLGTRAEQIAYLALRYAVPTAFGARIQVAVGGLMSYGADRSESFRLFTAYVVRVLKGEKPADLPVLQPTKFELVINAETARMLGLTVPPMLLARADEVIE